MMTTTQRSLRPSRRAYSFRLAAAALCVCGLIGTGGAGLGCASNQEADTRAGTPRPARQVEQGPTNFDEVLAAGDLPSQVWPREQYYRNALALMTNAERLGFFEQTSDYKRDLYLREIGADARVDLRVLLRPGMSLNEVRRRLANEQWDAEPVRFGFSEMYSIQRFNGRGFTRILVTMYEDELAGWNTYSDQQWARDEAILAECSRMEANLDRILERGMSVSGLRNLVRLWPQQQAQAFLVLADTSQYRESRETWHTHVRRAEFEERLRLFDILTERTEPDASPNTVDYYARRLKQPDATRTEVNRVFWRYDVRFGNRMIHMYLVWDEAELVDWYVEPMPDLVETR